MSYVSKKEKVFDLPDHEDSSSSSLIKGADHRLKIFPSVCDSRPSLEDCQKYQQTCGPPSGKEPGIVKSTGFKYIPFDVLLTILMAEKDAYIQELVERQEKCTCGERLFKANQFDDIEDDKEALIRKDAEVVALKNRNAVLETELDECRDTLRKAMHKLENVEGILNENIFLKDKLKYAEDMINILEENKKSLEEELKNCSAENNQAGAEGDHIVITSLYNERDSLREEIRMLHDELNRARVNAEEIDMLKRQSETVLLNLEEMAKENECYKRKLEGMKCLEKHVEDLKKQAQTLTEKYKRESHKSNEQLKQINVSSRELQILRDERDILHKRIADLSSFENEYYSLKKKLSGVEQIIEENEVLNSRLMALDKLESENQQLKLHLENLKSVEKDSSETKKKMVQLQTAFVDQEEEIKGLLSKIELLSKGYNDQKDLNRLKSDLQEKSELLVQYENQLKDIPILESEIDHLRGKLQKCMDDFMSDQKLLKRLQDDLEAYKEKCRELEESLTSKNTVEPTYVATRYVEKVGYAEQLAVTQELVKETCSVIEMRNSDVKIGEKFDGPKNELSIKASNTSKCEKMERRVQALEDELTDMLDRAMQLKEVIVSKDEKIKKLESEVLDLKNSLLNCSSCQELKERCAKLQNDIASLKDFNQQLQRNMKFEESVKVEKLEKIIRSQKKGCEFYKKLVKEIEGKLRTEIIDRQMTVVLSKLLKEESLLGRKEICANYLTEIESLKSEIDFLKTLIGELKKENQILQRMKVFAEFTGKKALESVLTKLRSELLVLQNLSKPELEAECEALQAEVKRLGSEINRLIDETEDLKSALEVERKSKAFLEKEFNLIQKELSESINAAMNRVSSSTMTMEYLDQSEEIKNTLNDIKVLKEENDDFVREIAVLQDQCKDFQSEITLLQNNMNELNKSVTEEKNVTILQKEEINQLNEKIKEYEVEMSDLKSMSEQYNQKSIALREELTAKEAELDRTKKELNDMKNEILKLNSEMVCLKDRLEENEESDTNNSELEKEGHEKQEPDVLVLKVEKEFEELRKKLELCSTTEEKLTVLRTKRDNLIVKVNCFESEVEFLKKKLIECDVMKTELEQLKAERKTNLQMNFEGEEKLLSDIFVLREQLKLQQKEIEHARSENSNLKDKLHDLGNLLEVCKRLHKSVPDTSSKTDVGISASDTGSEKIWEDASAIRVDNSTSCERLKDLITIDEFKLELTKAEAKYKVKVQKLKEGNAEKIKRLIQQYEKENKNRNKAYNESLNNIKSNYESDIRKLVERHKASILRLQSLHEDEVQELNTNYETQMEAMQTLNENVVNDLTSGAMEKSKLTEKHNKDIKDIEMKFQKLLKEKENQHMSEMTNLQENLTRNVNELEERHKLNVDNLTRRYEENIVQLKEKHSRDLRKCKRINVKRTDRLKQTYEDLLKAEKKNFEEQLQIMLDRLEKGQQGDQLHEDLKLVYLKQKSIGDRGNSLEFNKILQKIITGGLESIQFDELMLVHFRTCFAAENFFDDLNTRVEHEGDLVGDGCPHMPLMKAEKEELLKRIFILENEMAIKQLETHEAIINMESAEKCRVEELNTLLRNERDKNAELKLLLSNQTKAQTDLKIESYMLDRQASLHETNLIETLKQLEVEKSEKRYLEEELQKERNNSKRLNGMLEVERQRFKSQRKKDSDYIQAMRSRLEEALNHEQLMESQLDYEAEFRTRLETELQSLQTSFNLIIDQPSSALSLESKAVKDIKNFDRFESEKESKSKNRNKLKPQKNTEKKT